MKFTPGMEENLIPAGFRVILNPKAGTGEPLIRKISMKMSISVPSRNIMRNLLLIMRRMEAALVRHPAAVHPPAEAPAHPPEAVPAGHPAAHHPPAEEHHPAADPEHCAVTAADWGTANTAWEETAACAAEEGCRDATAAAVTENAVRAAVQATRIRERA